MTQEGYIRKVIEMSKFRSSLFVLFATLLTAGTAHAEGSLRPREIVFIASGALVRADPLEEPQPIAESITPLSGGSWSLAIKDRNTIFAGQRVGSEYRVWSIDVRNGTKSLLGSVTVSSFGCGWSGVKD